MDSDVTDTESSFFEALGAVIAEMEKKQHRPSHLECMYRIHECWASREWHSMAWPDRRNRIQGLGIYLFGQPHAIGDVFLYVHESGKPQVIDFCHKMQSLEKLWRI